MPTLRDRVRAPSPLAGRLATQGALYATGDGALGTASAVFFTQIVGLSAAQVGLGITIGGAVQFLAAVPSGRLVDRVGSRNAWAVSAFGTSLLYAVWPFVTGFGGFVAMMVVLETFGALGHAARGAYVLDVLPPDERVSSRAYMYSALNLGFTFGAALGGVALAFDSDPVVRFLPLCVAAIALVNAGWITRLPAVLAREHERPLEAALEEPAGDDAVPGALRNPGFVATSFFGGILQTNQVLLQIVIPLWLVEATDAPRVLLAWLFGTNTVLCIFLPMYTSRGVRDVRTALRATRISSVFFVGSCLITLVTHQTVGLLTIALVWLGHVTVTGAELYFSAAEWSFEAELSDPNRRGDYQGVAGLGHTLGYVAAPAAYTWLAIHHGTVGWLVIAAIVVVATAGLHPSTAAAERFLVRHRLDPHT